MSADQVAQLDDAFVAAVRAIAPSPVELGALSAERATAVFDSQARSRHLDFAARRLRGRGLGFYTISSAGHEANAFVAEATAVTDPALLHYRSGAFFVHRASAVAGEQPLRDVLLGVVASRDEPISGGRHKVFGSASLSIPPQTSTIASHLPKAVGMAFGFERQKRLGLDISRPADSIVVCSFGDASANHSTAVGAIHTACASAYRRLGVPVLFVCEDNGLGISVPTPRGWIAAAYGARPNLAYFHADGADPVAAHAAATAAVAHVRTTRSPAFLHLGVVRFMGHAGSDVELGYRTPVEIRADYDRDPLVATARALLGSGALSAEAILARYEHARAEVADAAEYAASRPHLRDAADIMAPISPRRPDAVAADVARPADDSARHALWDTAVPEAEGPLPLVGHINRALGDLLAKYPELIVFGEDVGRKGGVYGATRGLAQRAGHGRVFDTVLDEQSILGVAIGAGQNGMLPVAEIQYLAYLHNAIDQLRGEAASLSFFSNGQLRNPMVVRIAGYAYQKGFGGHFHNDNAIASLRDIPGLIIASPSRGDDAAAMLRTCVAAAKVDGAVSVFLEPIALYGTRDLYEDGDGRYAMSYDPTGPHVPLGRAAAYGEGDDMLLVSFANGVRMSLRAARTLEREHGLRCRVLDLRWLAPLPVDDLVREARACKRVLVVDETRASGGVSEGIFAALIDADVQRPLARVTSRDSFIPLGDAAHHVLMQEPDIIAGAVALAAR